MYNYHKYFVVNVTQNYEENSMLTLFCKIAITCDGYMKIDKW